MSEPEKLIPPHGGYRKLKSFQVSQFVYDVTVRFRDRYIEKRSRTHDQMVQAARSGVHNIAEASQASGTSRKMELKLTNVARASLEELRLDYEDFLRHRGLPQWLRDDLRRADLIDARSASADDVAEWVRAVHDGRAGIGVVGNRSIESTRSTYAEISANGALALLAVACSLLERKIAALERSFVEEGGFTERLHLVRTARRSSSS